MPSNSQREAARKFKPSRAGDLCYTVADFNREFPNDHACFEYITEQRWPKGVTKREKCNIERNYFRVSRRIAFACDRIFFRSFANGQGR